MALDLSHGGALAAMRQAFPNAPPPWLDLSTGINPWPYPFSNIPNDAFTQLPDSEREEAAREAMAEAWDASPEAIALTPGSQAGLQILPRLVGATRVGIVGPTYSEHARVWAAQGAHIIHLATLPANLMDFDAIIVVNPNNPDGRLIAPHILREAAARMAPRNAVLIVDEAFADLDPGSSIAPDAGAPGLIVLRSFGKFYGLAGLRLGALLAAPDLIERARALLGPWAVAGPALAIAARAYLDHAWANVMRRKLRHAADTLDDVLQGAGFSSLGGTSLFRFAAHAEAPALWRKLAESGVYVRRFDWTPHHLRFGLPASDADMERLTGALHAR